MIACSITGPPKIGLCKETQWVEVSLYCCLLLLLKSYQNIHFCDISAHWLPLVRHHWIPYSTHTSKWPWDDDDDIGMGYNSHHERSAQHPYLPPLKTRNNQPMPVLFGKMDPCPDGPTHCFELIENWLKIDSSCPKMNRGLLSTGLRTLRLPPYMLYISFANYNVDVAAAEDDGTNVSSAMATANAIIIRWEEEGGGRAIKVPLLLSKYKYALWQFIKLLSAQGMNVIAFGARRRDHWFLYSCVICIILLTFSTDCQPFLYQMMLLL